MKKQRPPSHLRPATRRWWSSVVAEWQLDPHHIRLLTLACEAWDRCSEAREIVQREGLTTPTRDGGSKLHPAARVESDSRIAFARLVRELNLRDTGPDEAPRPPALAGRYTGRP